MVHKVLTFAFLLGTAISAYGQYQISGRTVDNENVGVAFAHVLLFDATSEQETFVAGTTTDGEGGFVLSIEQGTSVYVQVQVLGYVTYRTEDFFVDGNVDLGQLILEQGSQQLDEVTVVGRKPLFEQRVDRTVVNVQGSVTNIGNNVLNVLSKSPMVRVNRAGNEISMMGKQGVVVMIDDKPVQLEPLDLMNLLGNMSSNNIESIELITSPPSNYDAQGNAGIINIKTIRGEEGFSGQWSSNLAYGRRPKYGSGLNLSYQRDRWYAYANLSVNIAHDYEQVYIQTESTELGTTADLFSLRKPTTGLYTLESGLEYKMTPKTTIGALVSVLYSDWEMDSWTRTLSIRGTDSTKLRTTSYEENKLFRTLVNLNMQHTFSERSKLSLDYDLIKFERKNPTRYMAEYEMEGTTNEFVSSATTPVTVHVLKSDLEHRFSDKLTLEYGVKGSFSDFGNQVVVGEQEDSGLVEDPNFTDDYSMDERIYAAYSSLGHQFGPKWKLQAGLRYEYYDLDLSSTNSGRITQRSQGYLFPSTFLTYRPSERQEWGLSYVSRIQRPGFLILAPYFYFFDENTLFTGNPSILPSRSNQFQLNFSHKGLMANLQYNWESDPVLDQQPTLDLEGQLLVVRPIQGEKRNALTLNVSHPIKLADWWNGHFNILATRLYQSLDNYSEPFIKTSYNYELGLVQNWDLGKKSVIEMSANYYSPYYFGVMEIDPRFQLDLGLRKKFRSGIVLAFNISDVFDTGSQWPSNSDIDNYGLDYGFKFDGEGPVFRLNLSMPIGRGKPSDRSKRQTGSEEMQRRLN
ncbi:TonB-dependent receptor [Allomuricauda taeanensis]|uniref:TonB-dependent receptor domain-containing protein n=1 Tax=Flagellimonas taeanensis TaxID=1005926 RepID=UPI002E7AC131|nr:TonB-dependent receptor [Allomuricauda taeanensis]MEE1964137.1 TonB-dependent receptor [Allomuricauda taeanensis]